MELTTLAEWASSRGTTYPLADKIKTVFGIESTGSIKRIGRPAMLYPVAKLDRALALVTGFKNVETTTEVASIDCSQSPEVLSDTTAMIDW